MGNRFDVQLVWSPAAQQYVLESIDDVCSGCPGDLYDAPVLDPVVSRGSMVVAYEVERRAGYSVGEPGPWGPVGTVSAVDPVLVDVPPAPSGGIVAAADEWQAVPCSRAGTGGEDSDPDAMGDAIAHSRAFWLPPGPGPITC